VVFAGFTTFRLSLPTRQRDALDTLASKLLAMSRTRRGYPPKDFWWRWIQQAYPRFSAGQCKMMANYALMSAASGVISAASAFAVGSGLPINTGSVQSALGDLSSQQQLVLQEAMSQKDTFEQMFSNMLKSFSGAASGIIANVK
jgi:hypothetical protein